jgi:hypothetical protein
MGSSTRWELAGVAGALEQELRGGALRGSWLDRVGGWASAGIGRAERVLVISDALDPVERLAAGLGTLRGMTGGVVSVLRVLSAAELSPWACGFRTGARVLDGEGGRSGERRMPRDWSGYRAAMAAHDAAVVGLVRSLGGMVIQARAEDLPVEGLRQWATVGG